MLTTFFIGINSELLEAIGHAPIHYDPYSQVVELNRNPIAHTLWLRLVT